MWPTVKSTFKTSFESSLDAGHNGITPPAPYLIHTPRYSVLSFDAGYIWYLGLGMRYEAGICTIVISMNRAFSWCSFCCRLNFDPKSRKPMDYSLWWSAIFDKNVMDSKIHFQDIIWKLFWCWSQWHNPQLHISCTDLDTLFFFFISRSFSSILHFTSLSSPSSAPLFPIHPFPSLTSMEWGKS